MEEVDHIIGMPFNEFIVFYAWALLGALLFFLYSLYKSLKMDKRTPKEFTLKHFMVGAIRVVLSIIGLAVAVVFWDNLSMMMFAVDEPVPLKGFSAFLVGTLVDRLLEVLLGGGDEAIKSLPKKKKP